MGIIRTYKPKDSNISKLKQYLEKTYNKNTKKVL